MPATSARPDRPNLLLIMSDEHAPMFSGPHRHPLDRTPYLSKLAAEGVLFEHAYCNSPLCVPSRMAFMTGRYVHHTNVSFIAPHFPLVVPQRFWDLYPPDEVDRPAIPPGHLQSQKERLLIRAATSGQSVENATADAQRRWYASGSTGGPPA